MTIIGKRRKVANIYTRPAIEEFVNSLEVRNTGYFGSSETDACVAFWGAVEIPAEIVAVL